LKLLRWLHLLLHIKKLKPNSKTVSRTSGLTSQNDLGLASGLRNRLIQRRLLIAENRSITIDSIKRKMIPKPQSNVPIKPSLNAFFCSKFHRSCFDTDFDVVLLKLAKQLLLCLMITRFWSIKSDRLTSFL
jgi:hypothetical protein